jgi:hypothetical protein
MYPLTPGPSGAWASVELQNASGNQSVATTSGTLRIEADKSHAHLDADGGFNQPPDFSTQSGHVHIVVDISC